MSAGALLGAAVLSGCSVALLVWSPTAARLASPDVGRGWRAPRTEGPVEGRTGGQPPDRSPPRVMVLGASALVGVAIWLLAGGLLGLALGGAAVALIPQALARLEPAGVRRRRLALVRAAPLVADLLAACLLAGVPLDRAVPVVARAVGGPAGSSLSDVHRRTQLGEPHARAWATLAAEPGLGGIARTVARSARTGAPLATLLGATADDLRAEAAAAALAEVRATAVRAVLPLGLCLLPAFALLGIAPIVGGLVPSL